jgi:peptidyl-prolyl cis-trans isomerase B (cyclophilin B)
MGTRAARAGRALHGARGANTGGSQFFIVLSEANTRHLNGVHTVFGKVTQGMDVVNQIRAGDRMERVTVADDAQA